MDKPDLVTIKVTRDTRTLLNAISAWTGESQYKAIERIVNEKAQEIVPMTVENILKKGKS